MKKPNKTLYTLLAFAVAASVTMAPGAAHAVPSYVHGETFGDTCWGVLAWILN